MEQGSSIKDSVSELQIQSMTSRTGKTKNSHRQKTSFAKASKSLIGDNLDPEVDYEIYAYLYEQDPKFDLHEMLKDESEDEEDQVDF